MRPQEQNLSRIWRFAAQATLAALGFALCAPCAKARSPLLQEGKNTLFQRIVTHPGAQLYEGPEEGAAIRSPQIKTFSALYVYARQGSRLEVGASSDKADGWIDSSSCTYWPQAITMVFTDRTGRAPVLFFRDHESLEKTCQASSIRETVQGYAKTLAAGTLPPDFPIIASEPQQTAVAEKNFYLMPVLGIDRQYSETAGLNLLEVASINPGIAKPKNNEPATSGAPELRTGFAFVIDTTISMKPYIDETVRLVRELYDELEKSPHGDKMAFAVVAFRSDTKRTKGLDYTAKVICDFKTVRERAELEKALSQVREATVSTHDFNEDSFAGVKEAADHLNWKEYGSRAMLLISDAGPLREGDPSSATGLSPNALADYLRTNKIYLTAVHIKSPSGLKNHKYAEQSYKTLTMQSDNQASYIALNASTAAKGTAAFERTGKILAQSYAKVVEATAQGKFLSAPVQQALRSKSQPSPEDEARRIAASTGYAMQLQFLGNARGATAPQVVKAWIADADLEKIETNGEAPILAAEPAVLLTKNQLSNLYQQLKVILRGSE
ncbi:MAG: VWA domain-containing protein, partial [Deltaproteobacteria bacterium]|nr:VWA domain-containing protein [Deltaproteobacteria bacterium]